ncbi:Cadherin-related family member [Trichinella spiralis]|uniref:Cadherin-related family member n=1 Tax=Trichinella spiralis TaxID=6334 RepID=A0ABR3K411_TRISP
MESDIISDLTEELKKLKLNREKKESEIENVTNVTAEMFTLLKKNQPSKSHLFFTSHHSPATVLTFDLKMNPVPMPHVNPISIIGSPWLCVIQEKLIVGCEVKNKNKTVANISAALVWKEKDSLQHSCKSTTVTLLDKGGIRAANSIFSMPVERSFLKPNESAQIMISSVQPSQAVNMHLLIEMSVHQDENTPDLQYSPQVELQNGVPDLQSSESSQDRLYAVLAVHAAFERTVLRVEKNATLEQLYLRQVAATHAGIHRCTLSALKTLHAFRIDGEACFLVIYDISRAKLSQYLELLSRSLEVVECRPLTVEAEIEDVLLQLSEQRVKHLEALYDLLSKTDSNGIPLEQYRILRLKLAQVQFCIAFIQAFE